MKTNRKKMLLSSIAMLLVALVALGSATYAWFTMNKTVSADGMQVTAATSAGLQITGTNGNGNNAWVRDYHFAAFTDALNPTSLGYTGYTGTTKGSMQTASYLPGEVERDGAYAEASGSTTASATKWAAGDTRQTNATLAGLSTEAKNLTANNQIAAYRVGVRSSRSDTDISGVTMTLAYDATNEANNAGQFIRIVVTNTSDEVVAYYAGGGATAVTGVANQLPSTTAAQPSTNSLEYALESDVTNANPQYYNIYVWYEGQDEHCVDANQAAVGALNIKFSYT